MIVSDIYELHRSKEDEALSGNPPAVPENLFFMKQYIQNSCGTMAIVHSVRKK
jgi:Ubiquitin carboxyl-terminal hydrolase, family 1